MDPRRFWGDRLLMPPLVGLLALLLPLPPTRTIFIGIWMGVYTIAMHGVKTSQGMMLLINVAHGVVTSQGSILFAVTR
jgi:uncharacterized membrane protein